MKTHGLLFLVAGGVAAGCAPAAVPPPPVAPSFGALFKAALDQEATSSVSAGPYLDLVDQAVQFPEAPGALAAAVASLDALVLGPVPGFELLGNTAIAYRSREGMGQVVGRLRAAWAAGGAPSESAPLVRGQVAAALHALALFGGDAGAAQVWGQRRGCATEATVVGPLDWAALRSLEDPSPIAWDGPLAARYPGIAPFEAALVPTRVRADACVLDVNASSRLEGVRAVVMDLEVPRAQRVSLALSTGAAAVVEVGGVTVLRRAYELGGRPVQRLGAVDVAAGRTRVVVRLAERQDGSRLELDAWGDDGLPLAWHAPAPGESATARGSRPAGRELAPATAGPDDALLTAAGLLGLGEARAAEHLLEPHVAGAPASAAAPPPAARPFEIELLYARALQTADDLPENKVTERVRGAVDRVLAAAPGSWEARVQHALATERRRGAGEGVVEGLRELGVTPAMPGPPASAAAPPAGAAGARATDRMELAWVAMTAKRATFLDLAERAYASLEAVAPGSPLLAGADVRVHGRAGADAVRVACTGATGRAENTCLDAHRERGDFPAALAEIERLRALRGSPDALRAQELWLRMMSGDTAGALALYDVLPPAERRLGEALAYAVGKGQATGLKERLARDETRAGDAPQSIGALARLLGVAPDPAPAFEAEGRRLVAADRQAAFLPGAGTAVLRHVERYAIAASGLTRYVSYDLRRVSGTTDVAMGGSSFGPAIEGRGFPRLLRRTILKRDGRILEPDAAANAQQGAADMAQLETGDYVEQIVQGWSLPGETGQLVIDTPDLLPERTSVREAELTVQRDASVPLAIWAHPLLGKPTETTLSGGAKSSTWRLTNAPPRRVEDGIPRMERSVGVSLGTQTWEQVARGVADNLRALDEHDPYVARWAAEAAAAPEGAAPAEGQAGLESKRAAPSRALVERIVAASGKTVKAASPGDLSDVAAMYGAGPQRTTARSILELGQGSRSWVIYRALRELGVPVDLAIAETEPYSESPGFPPHVGRFRHALVIARLGDNGGDLWIDADVSGPPLPAGRISPELRGRSAMLSSGKIVTVEGSVGETGDEIDERLTVDDRGDAKGTFTVLLHGTTAQALADAFETVVGTDRREMLRNVVLGWVPWADVDDVTLSSSEGSWEVSLRATVAIHGYGRPEGKGGKTWVIAGLEPVHLVFPRATVSTLGATYASRGARQNALSIDAPMQYHLHRRIQLPAGAQVTRAPGGTRVTDPHLSGERRGAVTAGPAGALLEEDFTLSLPTGTVSAESYGGFVARVHTVDDGFMAGIHVQVKP